MLYICQALLTNEKNCQRRSYVSLGNYLRDWKNITFILKSNIALLNFQKFFENHLETNHNSTFLLKLIQKYKKNFYFEENSKFFTLYEVG